MQDFNRFWRPIGWNVFLEHGVASDECHKELNFYRSSGPGPAPESVAQLGPRKGRKKQRDDEYANRNVLSDKLSTRDIEAQQERRLARDEVSNMAFFTDVQARNSKRCITVVFTSRH